MRSRCGCKPAAVAGRLVDADGKPRPNIEMSWAARGGPQQSNYSDAIKTDADGRFLSSLTRSRIPPERQQRRVSVRREATIRPAKFG